MNAFQVIVVGAGPAGLSAAMYLQKAGMKTLVIGDGRTLLHSALLDNTYLGITEPMLGETFFQRATEQVENMGVTLLEDSVVEIVDKGAHYEVHTEDEGTFQAEYLVLASGIAFDTAELGDVEFEENDEPFIKKRIKMDPRGRTGKRNMYVTGIAAGIASQAIIAAGHGAQVAINLLSDIEEKRVCIHDRKPRPEPVA